MKTTRLILCFLAAVVMIPSLSAQQSGYFDDYLRRHGGIFYTQWSVFKNQPNDLHRASLAGDVKRVEEYRSAVSTTEPFTVMEFDENGFITSETYTERGTRDRLKIDYTYDYNNKRLASITVNRNGSVETAPVLYDANGRITGAEYDGNGSMTAYKGVRYNFSMGAWRMFKGVADKSEKYIYNFSDGRLTDEEYDGEVNGTKASISQTYMYDKNGHDSGGIRNNYKQGTQEPLVVKSGGNTYTAKPTPSSYNYKLDNKNNWISRTNIIADAGAVTRKIDYYGSGITVRNTPGGRGTSTADEDESVTLDCEITLSQQALNQSTSDYPWNGKHSQSMQGRGTSTEPYLVTSAGQMACIAQWVLQGKSLKGEHFVLMTDLDLSNSLSIESERNWIPIGTAQTPFAGKFYGNGYKISNLSIQPIDKKKVDIAGVFGYISADGLVRDLTVDESCNLKAETAGGIAAVNNGTISYCKSSAIIDATTAGGVAGLNNGLILGCISNAKVDLLTDGGGIAGKSKGTIDQCVFRGTVTYFTLSRCAGGIVGEILAGGTVTDCYHRGKVEANIVGITPTAGGIAGNKNLPDGAKIVNCYVAGKVKGNFVTGNLIKNISKVENTWFDFAAKGGFSKSEKKEQQFYMDNGARTTEQMKDSTFVTQLNNGRPDGPWVADVNEINGGYPILETTEIYPPQYICSVRQLMISTGANLIIHKDGVGLMRFGDRNPDLGPGYTVKMEKDHEWGDTDVWYAYDKSGEVVVEYYPTYLMTVFGEEFRTTEGVRIGMTLTEVRKLIKNYKIELIAHGGSGELYVQFNKNMVFRIAPDDIKGGYEAYNEWWMKGGELTISDVEESAIVCDIRVKNE